MGSAKVMFPIVRQPLAPSHPIADSPPHPVAVRVTADVHVYRYDDSQSSADESSSRVVVVTSLSAIVKGLSSTDVIEKGEEYLAGPSVRPSVSFDIYSHPTVRRSKKGTCLNKTDISKVGVQSTISRMILLPYPGCSKGKPVEAAQQKKVFVKSSKTWETVNLVEKRVEEKRTRSQILNLLTGSTKISRQAPRRASELDALFDSENCVEDLIKSVPDKAGNTSQKNVRQSLSESQILFKDERSRMYLCSPLDDVLVKTPVQMSLKESYPDRSELGASLAGFEEGVLTPPDPVRAKSTRNVSILHRPRTRHKATSTTSLNEYFGKKEQNLDESIKGVLMPYIAAGNYPSELVLKLVPKKQIEEEMKKEEHYVEGSTRFSEDNLLAPKLNDAITSKKSKKKKRKCCLLCCFSKTKKADSDESVATKVYYPSIVEVHEGKYVKTSVEEYDSDFTFTLEESSKPGNKR